MMVAERERVSRLIAKNQHARTRPPPVPPQKGGRERHAQETQTTCIVVRLAKRSAKTD